MQKTKEQPNQIIFGDSINIRGDVEIINGDTHIKAKNKFVQTILQLILNWLAMTRLYHPTNAADAAGPATTPNMYIGTDTTTPTVFNTAALTSPIGGAPGTAPNLLIGNTTNPSNGVFKITLTSTWNAGTVVGTVGEMALYLNLNAAPANLQAYGWSAFYSEGAAVLASRLSVANADFVAFVIDNTKPLVITWTITVSF